MAILTGTDFGFSRPDGDHHVGRITTVLDVELDDDVVTVQGTFGVRDWSGDWDDDYQGSLQFVLLAELATGVLPSNLSITGVEYTQAIQHFRAQLHLDPASAGPDNSIPLVRGKDTVLRVYVDTGTDPTRPAIGQVSGLLEIRSPGGGWNPIAPLNGPLAPIRDRDIRRGNQDATLNFVIPGAFSTGSLEIRVRAFDAVVGNRPDLGYASGLLQDTLRFRAVEPLRVRGVLVNYTGSPAVPAPSIGDLRSTLAFVEQTYPVGEVVITGVDVIDDDGDYTDMSGDGCGSGWGGLLDTLREMRGDRDDIYYGLLPAAVPRGWGGCGGGGVAAGPVGRGSTAAQEIAHAFNRDHAPCGNPGDPDPNYPAYDALPMGSIGEFGMDPTGQVQDPATVEDFMSYCSPRWVSPYTYLGLLTAFPTQEATARAALESEPIAEHLFLPVHVLRGGRVEVHPGFHYRSRRLPRHGRPTPYVIELRDCYDRPLVAQRLRLSDPHTNLDDADLHLLAQLPMPTDAVRVVVLCSETACANRVLHTVDIPTQIPDVRITAPKPEECTGQTIRVAWSSSSSDLHYLVRFSNNDGASWRTLAPRTSAQHLDVNTALIAAGKECRFQVLATSGVRTGAAVSKPFQLERRPRLLLMNDAPAGTTVRPGEPVELSAEAFSPDSGSAPSGEIEWRSDRDGTLGRGRRIRFASLTPGAHTITATVPDGCGGTSTTSTRITVKPRTTTGHRGQHDDAGRHQHRRSR